MDRGLVRSLEVLGQVRRLLGSFPVQIPVEFAKDHLRDAQSCHNAGLLGLNHSAEFGLFGEEWRAGEIARAEVFFERSTDDGGNLRI